MTQNSIYKSLEGKKALMDIYDKHMTKLNINFKDIYVQTRFGKTHIVNLGNSDAKPLLCLHGGNSNTPDMLISNIELFDKFNIFAVDTIGHPGKSDETKLSSDDLSYGYWLLDVIDELGFDQINIYAGSFGAGIAIRLATVAPSRINKMVLVVPSGIATESLRDKATLMFPYLRYKIHSSQENLIKLCSTLMTRFDNDRLELLQAIFKYVKINSNMPRPAKDGELGKLAAPIMVIAAKNDIMFPGSRVIPRAKELFPNLTYSEIIDGLHEPTKENYNHIQKISIDFFNNNQLIRKK